MWFKTNAAALTPEGANILGFGFGLGNNLPALFVSTVSCLFDVCLSSALLYGCVWPGQELACAVRVHRRCVCFHVVIVGV